MSNLSNKMNAAKTNPSGIPLKPVKASLHDATRFSEIVNIHLNSLYSTALRMTRNEMEWMQKVLARQLV